MNRATGSLRHYLPIAERVARLPGRALIALAGITDGLLLLVGFLSARSHRSFVGWFPFSCGVVLSVILIIFAVRWYRLSSAITATYGAAIDRFTARGARPGSHVPHTYTERSTSSTSQQPTETGTDFATQSAAHSTADSAEYPPQYSDAEPTSDNTGAGIVIDEDGNILNGLHGPDPEGLQREAARLAAKERAAAAQREAAIRKDTFFPRIEQAQRVAIAAAGGVDKVPYLRDDLRWTLLSGIITLAAIPLTAFLILWALLMWA
ncbi:hypothetical protein [Trueperella sp. LYQ143]|uniref:hypothetical protein n=1 Tax=unclassified Trueperella TaxID=2630174 RepID=UPI0039830DE8